MDRRLSVLQDIADGRTDMVFEYLAEGHAANSVDGDGVSLLQWCSYYGDVSAMKFLLANGESLDSLGDNYGLIAACFHGHWRLCQFLVERGADVNEALPDTGETPLHSAAVHNESSPAQRGDESPACAWSESELRDEGIGGDRRVYERLPNERGDTASPSRRFRG